MSLHSKLDLALSQLHLNIKEPLRHWLLYPNGPWNSWS
jgi:hypothetical protein